MSNTFKKIVSVTTSVTTIVWVSGIAMLAPMAASAVVGTIAEGDTIKTADNPDVYIAKYVGTKAFKRLILNPDVFNSYKHLSWSKIKTVSQAEMDQFTLSDLVRADGDSKVYKLIANGDVGTKQWMNMTAEQFVANGNDWDSIYVINNTDRDNYTAGTDVTGTGTVTAGTVSVALASNTAAATTLVDGSAAASLASFTLTAPSTGAVKVTGFKAKRLGVSADTTLSNVYLYEGVNRLTDSATVSSGVISWTNTAGIFTVPAGSSKTITVKSDIADGVAGETVGVGINAAADITTDGATVSGTFPINGNTHSTANASLATVSFNTTTNPASDGSPVPQDEFELWSNVVNIATRAVDLNYITFRQIGSVLAADLQNFKLMIDGTQVGTTVAQVDANGYITFDLTASPKRLQTGNRTFKILVNIVGGSSRTTSLSLRNAADAIFVDSEFGANVLVQANSTTFSARTSTAQTIGTGTLTMTKRTDSPSGNVTDAASSVTLAKFDVKATGENVKVENLTVTVDESDNDTAFTLRNAALYLENTDGSGSTQIGSSFSMRATSDTTATSTISLGSSMVIVPGAPKVLKVVADIFDNDGTNQVAANDTLTVRITAGASNAQRVTALTFFNAPTADVTANALTVATGAVALAKYSGYADQNMVAPKTAVKLGDWRLTAGTTENINLTAFEPDWDNSAGPDVAADVTNCSIKYGENAEKETTAKPTIASTTDSFSINHTLNAGAVMRIELYCTVGTTISGSSRADLTVRGTTVQSATTADSSETAGQVITWTTGSLAAQSIDSDPIDRIVYSDGTNQVTAANYRVTATNDTFTVSQVAIKFASAAQAASVKAVRLYDGTTQLTGTAGTVVDGSGYATTTGLTWQVTGNKTLTVKLDLNNVGSANASSSLNASTTLVSILQMNSAGTLAYTNPTAAQGEGNAIIVYKTYPTVSHSQLTDSERTVTNDASQTVYKFTIKPTGGSLALKQFKLSLAWTDATNLAALELESVKLFRGSTDLASIITVTDEDGNTIESTSGALEDDDTMVFAFADEDTISAETTYTVKATPKNFDSGTTSHDSVAINMAADTSEITAQTTRYAINPVGDGIWLLGTSATQATGGTAANFVWSDINQTPHSALSSSASADWFSGYKVLNLPLDSTVMRF